METQVVISLLATAISFLDALIADTSRNGGNAAVYVDTRHVIGSAIALLRGDADADVKLDMANQRRKDKPK